MERPGEPESGAGQSGKGLPKRTEAGERVLESAALEGGIGPCSQDGGIRWQIAPGLCQHDLGLCNASQTQKGARAGGICKAEFRRQLPQQRPETCGLHPLTCALGAQGAGEEVLGRLG